MKPLSTEKEIASYQRGVEQSIAGLDHTLEAGYLHIEKKYFVKGSTLDTTILETPKGRLAVVDDLVQYISSKLEEILGFELDNEEQRRIAFKHVIGASQLELEVYFANDYKALARGNMRAVFEKKKKETVRNIYSKVVLGAGLREDHKTGKLVKAKEGEPTANIRALQEIEDYAEAA